MLHADVVLVPAGLSPRRRLTMLIRPRCAISGRCGTSPLLAFAVGTLARPIALLQSLAIERAFGALLHDLKHPVASRSSSGRAAWFRPHQQFL